MPGYRRGTSAAVVQHTSAVSTCKTKSERAGHSYPIVVPTNICKIWWADKLDLVCSTAGASLAMVRSGQVKAFAVTSQTRMASAPEIPTVDEAGLPSFYIATWF